MLIQYFITVVIPLVVAAMAAALGWFASEAAGAFMAGTTALVAAASWTCYSWYHAPRQRLRQERDKGVIRTRRKLIRYANRLADTR